MKTSRGISTVYASVAVTAAGLGAGDQAAAATISPSTLPQLTTVDERFQSYNVEMAEVIGGNFWKPYAKRKPKTATKPITAFEIGKDPAMFEKRAPVDLDQRTPAQARRRAGSRLCAGERHLGQFGLLPGYGRGRSRADARRLPERADPTPMGWSYRLHPCGKRQAGDLIRHQQRRPRREGIWTPAQAQPLVAYTNSIGGTIAAAELFNEPTIAASGGAPAGYNARDLTPATKPPSAAL